MKSVDAGGQLPFQHHEHVTAVAGVGVGCRFTGLKEQFPQVVETVLQQAGLALPLRHPDCRFRRGQGGAFQPLLHVEFPPLPVWVAVFPVVQPEGGIAGGLDFDQGNPCTQRMDGATWEIVAVTGLYRDGVQDIFRSPAPHSLRQRLAIHTRFQTFVDHGAGFGVQDVPALGLGVGPGVSLGVRPAGMDLHRQVFAGIQVFHQQRETAVVRPG